MTHSTPSSTLSELVKLGALPWNLKSLSDVNLKQLINYSEYLSFLTPSGNTKLLHPSSPKHQHKDIQ